MWKQQGVSRVENSQPSGPTKRARPAVQAVSCLVDGCVSDLSNCRDYHRRHKVCEIHSKTSQVSIGGRAQRFCQQCSRFHSLEEFDEGKRSCRKRLDGHNRRRRKVQPDSLFRSVSILPNFQDAKTFPFSSPHEYPSPAPAAINHSWSTDAGQYIDLHQRVHFNNKLASTSGSSLNIYKGEKQFPFFQGNNLNLINHTSHKTSVSAASPRLEAGSDRQNMFRISTQFQDMDCALSLLSPKQTHSTPENQMKQQHESSPWMHCLNQNVHDIRTLGLVDSMLVSSSRDAEDGHCS